MTTSPIHNGAHAWKEIDHCQSGSENGYGEEPRYHNEARHSNGVAPVSCKAPTPYAVPPLVRVAPVQGGKGLGVVACADLGPGDLLLDEVPLLLLDPPTKRRDLQMMLGCRKFSSIDMGAHPDKIRAQVQQMILELLVAKMAPEARAALFSLSDRRAEVTGGSKTLWGVWETNCVPCGSYRASAIFPVASRLNHSCLPNASSLWSAEKGRYQVRAAAAISAGEEVTISYVRTFCSRTFRQQLLQDRFHFVCSCRSCSLTGPLAEEDDRLRLKIDDLSQKFIQARQNSGEDLQRAAELGERLLLLMQEVGFDSSVQWPGFLNCFEIYAQLGDEDRAAWFAGRAHVLACQARGEDSPEAARIARYVRNPMRYLADAGLEIRAPKQHGQQR